MERRKFLVNSAFVAGAYATSAIRRLTSSRRKRPQLELRHGTFRPASPSSIATAKIGFVQNVASNSGTSTSSLILTVNSGIATTVGNMLSLGFRINGGATVTKITDSAKNSWQIDAQGNSTKTNSGLASCIIASGKALSAGSKITLTFSAAVGCAAECEEYSSVASHNGMPVVDQIGNNYSPQLVSGVMGAIVAAGPNGGNLGANLDAATAHWGSIVYPVKATKIYLGAGVYPTDGSADNHLQTAIDQGLQACISYEPPYPDPGGTNLAKLVKSITALKPLLQASGGSIKVCFYNEVNSGNNLTAPQYRDMVSYYAPSVRKLCPFVFDNLIGSANEIHAIKTYFPGPPNLSEVLCDEVAGDYYCGAHKNGLLADSLAALADNNGVKFSFWELGSDVGEPGNDPGDPAWTNYVNYITGLVNARIAAGTPLGTFMWFQSNPKNPTNMITVGGAAFTANKASPCVFTISGGPMVFEDAGVVLSGSRLPGGFATGRTYYVVNVTDGPSAKFSLAAAKGGTPLKSTSSGSGTVADYRIAELQGFASVVNNASNGVTPQGITVASPTISSAGDLVRSVAGGNTATSHLTLTSPDANSGDTWKQTFSAGIGLGAGYEIGTSDSTHVAAWTASASTSANATIVTYRATT